MNKCFKCGVSEDRALLFGAVSEKGIVKICRKCSFEENIPIIKYLKEKPEKRPTVYERLSRLSRVEIKSKKDKSNKQNEELKKIADENFSKNVLDENPFDMVDNFHWIIMRARRARKLTQKQFAKAIEESEEAIKMAEKGVLLKNDFVLVNKIENYLGIRIKNKSAREKSFDEEVNQVKKEFLQNVEEDKIKFDDATTKTLTIADLQEMKKKRENEIFEKPVNKKIDLDKENLSQEEIDRIIFGK